MQYDTKAKAVSDKEEDDKPSITYKLKDDATTDTKAKAVSDKEEDTKAKAVSDKEEDTKAKAVSDKEEDTKAKAVSDKEDTKAKAVSDKEEDDKPAVTTKLSDNPPTDDKPETQHNEDKTDLSDEGKSTDDKSHVEGLLGSSDNTSLVADDDDEMRPLALTKRLLIQMKGTHLVP